LEAIAVAVRVVQVKRFEVELREEEILGSIGPGNGRSTPRPRGAWAGHVIEKIDSLTS
jgi:hypothetical protein